MAFDFKIYLTIPSAHLRQFPMVENMRGSVLTVPADRKSILKLVADTVSGSWASSSSRGTMFTRRD